MGLRDGIRTMSGDLIIPPLPSVVKIIGCGPSASEHFDDGGFAIALNGAILWPRRWGIFAAFDLGVQEELWWNVDRIYERADLLVLGEDFTSVDGQDVLKFKYKPTLYVGPRPLSIAPISKNNPLEPYDPLIPGVLRGSCSIAGCMLQYVVMGGAKDIYMYGVDMCGTAHSIGRPSSAHGNERDWAILNRLRRLVLCVERDYGVRVHWNRRDD
jgi:hypothetical protein